MASVIANLDFVKAKNIAVVFKAIVDSGAISRIQIARNCSLAAGSVTRIIRQLLESGLVREVAQQTSERGRKATLLEPVHEKFQILAARAGRTRLHIGLCDLSGKLWARYSEPLQAQTQQAFSDQLIAALLSFRENQRDKVNNIVGIGITTPGLVNSAQGIITFMPHLAVNDFHLADQVTAALGLPCYLHNFVAAMALAEYQFGVTKKCTNNIFVEIHNGLGAGMILDGHLYAGNNSGVGEIGHIQIDPLGKACYCGNNGCLETLVSNPAIEARCQQLGTSGVVSKLPRKPDINTICDYAVKGDLLARGVLREAAANLGKVIAMTVNLLRPERVVLAGEICKAWEVIEPVIQHCLRNQTVTINGVQPKVVQSQLYDSPWYGGYSLVRRALLEEGLLWHIIKQH